MCQWSPTVSASVGLKTNQGHPDMVGSWKFGLTRTLPLCSVGTMWGLLLISWFIIQSKYSYTTTVNPNVAVARNQLNAILGAPHCRYLHFFGVVLDHFPPSLFCGSTTSRQGEPMMNWEATREKTFRSSAVGTVPTVKRGAAVDHSLKLVNRKCLVN